MVQKIFWDEYLVLGTLKEEKIHWHKESHLSNCHIETTFHQHLSTWSRKKEFFSHVDRQIAASAKLCKLLMISQIIEQQHLYFHHFVWSTSILFSNAQIFVSRWITMAALNLYLLSNKLWAQFLQLRTLDAMGSFSKTIYKFEFRA